jgi:hypothetical protein
MQKSAWKRSEGMHNSTKMKPGEEHKMLNNSSHACKPPYPEQFTTEYTNLNRNIQLGESQRKKIFWMGYAT